MNGTDDKCQNLENRKINKDLDNQEYFLGGKNIGVGSWGTGHDNNINTEKNI